MITLFWRFETLTLNATTDHTEGSQTTVTENNTPTLNAAAARVGSLGALITGGSGHQYRWDLDTDLVNRLVGSVGFSIRFDTLPSGVQGILSLSGADGNYAMQLVAGNIRVYNNLEGTGEDQIDTTGAEIVADQFFGIIFRWDQPNSNRRIEIYDSSSVLIDFVEDNTAFTAPVNLFAAEGLRIGDTDGGDAVMHYDNFFLSKDYDEPIEDNFTITSFEDYASGSGFTLAVDSGSLALQGQASVFRTTNVIANGSLALEPNNVNLLADVALVLPVTHQPLALEGQQIPFILTNPGVDGALALQGQTINLVAVAILSIENAQLAAAGQNISLLFGGNINLPITEAALVLARSNITLTATGLTNLDENIVQTPITTILRDVHADLLDITREYP